MTYLKDKSEAPNKPASHDTASPHALLAFMTSSWKPAPTKLPKPIASAKAHALRRRALSARFAGELLVIPTGGEKVRSNDTVYRFRPGTEFFYLTGNMEPDCVLVLEPTATGHRDVIFVEPNPGKTDATFYTDRSKGELWVGPRLGITQSRARYGVHEARGLSELEQYLGAQAAAGRRIRTLRGFDARVEHLAMTDEKNDVELATFLSEMRLIKDASEVREIQYAIDATHRGFEDVIAALPRSKSERTIEGVFGLRAREDGNDVGYGTIAACGPHACTLHWMQNDGTVKRGDLLLLDAGVEARSLYTADITRALPVNGKFSKEQRAIYELVYESQEAAFTGVKPGNDFLEPNRRAMHVLAHGLERLGILPMSADEALKDENQFYKRYSLHNVSHMLGLDVHDCARARLQAYKHGKLEVGMVLTVEPGLYFQMDDLTVPKRYRGIGVRIEDDVVVTKTGMKNLSGKIPRKLAEVESWMKRVWKTKKH